MNVGGQIRKNVSKNMIIVKIVIDHDTLNANIDLISFYARHTEMPGWQMCGNFVLRASHPGRVCRGSHVLFAANGPRRVLRFRVEHAARRSSDADDGEWVAWRPEENKKKRKTERVGKNVLSATVFVRSFWRRDRGRKKESSI